MSYVKSFLVFYGCVGILLFECTATNLTSPFVDQHFGCFQSFAIIMNNSVNRLVYI